MPLAMRPRVIQVERSNRGFGLSLIYRGLDKYEEKETGIFVARVVPGGQAARFGVKENDKIISINNKSPRNVDDAVNIIKEAGKSIRLMLVRQEEVPGKYNNNNNNNNNNKIIGLPVPIFSGSLKGQGHEIRIAWKWYGWIDLILHFFNCPF